MESFEHLIAFLDVEEIEYMIKGDSGQTLYCSPKFLEIKDNAVEIEKNVFAYNNHYYDCHVKSFNGKGNRYHICSFHDISHHYNHIVNLKRDGTTTLPNRNAIDTYLQYPSNLINSYFVLCDVDDFKSVNDTYGHQVGDEVLKRVGMTFRKHLRECDFAGRYGGEEFLLIFNTDNLNAVYERLASMRKELSHDSSLPNLSVNFSSGITFYSGMESLEEIIWIIDHAMYYVKQNGKGCDAFYDRETGQYQLLPQEPRHSL